MSASEPRESYEVRSKGNSSSVELNSNLLNYPVIFLLNSLSCYSAGANTVVLFKQTVLFST